MRLPVPEHHSQRHAFICPVENIHADRDSRRSHLGVRGARCKPDNNALTANARAAMVLGNTIRIGLIRAVSTVTERCARREWDDWKAA